MDNSIESGELWNYEKLSLYIPFFCFCILTLYRQEYCLLIGKKAGLSDQDVANTDQVMCKKRRMMTKHQEEERQDDKCVGYLQEFRQ